tara:strand:- start:104 stop:1009 length:906 start_codon:yes stop_codon:yes gene_type:complete
MDIEDLRKFIIVARHENLHIASKQLAVTSGALSKIIKRLESKLQTQLFDRVGRGILLNVQGRKFLGYASQLVHETDQAISEFKGDSQRSTITIAGPSLLLQHYLPALADQLSAPHFQFKVNACWEGRALEDTMKGNCDLGIVTPLAARDSEDSASLRSIPLGSSSYVVAASGNHPLFNSNSNTTSQIDCKTLHNFAFACPYVSPFCGVKRGIGSDGWRDDSVPRQIKYRCNDFGTMMAIVEHGLALAYVPDFIATKHKLSVVDVMDYPHHYEESFELVYKPSFAFGWLNRFVDSLTTATTS